MNKFILIVILVLISFVAKAIQEKNKKITKLENYEN